MAAEVQRRDAHSLAPLSMARLPQGVATPVEGMATLLVISLLSLAPAAR